MKMAINKSAIIVGIILAFSTRRAHGRLECGTIAAPTDGSVSAPNTQYNGVATFTCNTGYTLTGQPTRTCQEDGTWQTPSPTCFIKGQSLEEFCPELSTSDSGSLLKKHLTLAVYEIYKDIKTHYKGTLADCIRSGCLNHNYQFGQQCGICGIYASDPDAYSTFSDVFDPILKDYHKVDKLEHPEPDFGNLDDLEFGDLDPKGEFIDSTRIGVRRNHQDYGFLPTMSAKKFEEVERMTVDALGTLSGELAGKYYPLRGMSKAIMRKMIADNNLLRDDDPCLRDANGYKDWPKGRGIFFSKNKKFLVLVNEEDHLHIISKQDGGNLTEVWQRLVEGIQTLEKNLTFVHRQHLGYLTFSPANLGTTLRASVRIRIPILSQREDFKAICEKLNLQPRGVHGEHSDSSFGGVYDISNKRRMGLSEIKAMQEMWSGVEKIIELEKGGE